jgi:DNA-binding GntR family transcriptional regulator
VASDLAHQLSLRVQRYVRMARADGRKRHVDAVEEHRAILEAVEKGDFRNACKLLEQHIQHTTEQVRRIFENGAPAGAGAAAQRAQRP